ncbi:MAG TPA: hypothetical protein VLA14_16135 [Polyangia bacterium]|nr:hypothetical protein [Polyangia bacterium]
MSGRRPSLTFAFAPLWIVAALTGCAAHAAAPGDTLAAFGAALERKDFDAAYGLTSNAYRARVPLTAFRASLDEGGADTQALGRELRTEVAHRPARVELEVEPGRTVGLVEEGGAWRVDGPSIEPWSQRTPHDALRSFVRALELRRYDIVLRLAPTQRRAALTVEGLRAYWEGERKADNDQLLAHLRAALGAPIVETGEEARMPYGARAEVHFTREDGLWKIEDLD